MQKLNAEVNRILKLPDVAEQLSSRGLLPLGDSSEDLAASMKAAHAHWGKVIAQIGLKPE